MSELNLMNPGNTSPTRARKREDAIHDGGGCSPGKSAKSTKPTPVVATPRPGLPILLAVLIALAVSVLSACDNGCEPGDGRTFADHALACKNLCAPVAVASYKAGNCECAHGAILDGGVR